MPSPPSTRVAGGVAGDHQFLLDPAPLPAAGGRRHPQQEAVPGAALSVKRPAS